MTGSELGLTPDRVTASWLVFELDKQRYTLPVERVQRVLRVVAITPLPGAPEIVLGVVDVAGAVLPVIDLRRRFGLPSRQIRLSDHLVLADTGRRAVALLVDAATDVVDPRPEDVAQAQAFLPGLAHVGGALMLESGLVLIHDLDRLLSLDEEAALDSVLPIEGSPSGRDTADAGQ